MNGISEKDRIRLLLNSDRAKEIKAWLLDGKIGEFDFLWWNVWVWRAWPFVTVSRITRDERL